MFCNREATGNHMQKRISVWFMAVTYMLCFLFSVGCDKDGNAEKEMRYTDIVLAQNGGSDYAVVLQDGAEPVLERMADEVVEYLERSTGARLPLMTDTEANGRDKVIAIGETSYFLASNIALDEKELTMDGFRIVRKGNNVILAGLQGYSSGYACLEFLAQQIGYEPYAADAIAYRKHDVLRLIDFDYKGIPAFETRMMDGLPATDMATAYRLRLNVVFNHPGGDAYGEAKDIWAGSIGHNSRELIENWTPHTDMFGLSVAEQISLRIQLLANNTTQLCYSVPNTEKAYAAAIADILTKNPSYKYVNISQEDGKDLCKCAQCTAACNTYTSAGYWIRILNKIIALTETWCAAQSPKLDVLYTTYLYNYTFMPAPVREENGRRVPIDSTCVPHEKLHGRIVRGHCMAHELTDPNCEINALDMETLKDWSALGVKMQTWWYIADYTNYIPFINDMHGMKDLYDTYRKFGANDVFAEYISGSNLTMFGYLRMYLHAKLMWNPDLELQPLIDGFFENYYGAAAEEMHRLLDLYQTHVAVSTATDKAFCARVASLRYTSAHWPKNVLEKAAEILGRAAKKAQTTEDPRARAAYVEHIRAELLCVRIMQLLFYEEYGYDVARKADLFDTVQSETQALNVIRFSEGSYMSQWLETIRATL